MPPNKKKISQITLKRSRAQERVRIKRLRSAREYAENVDENELDDDSISNGKT